MKADEYKQKGLWKGFLSRIRDMALPRHLTGFASKDTTHLSHFPGQMPSRLMLSDSENRSDPLAPSSTTSGNLVNTETVADRGGKGSGKGVLHPLQARSEEQGKTAMKHTPGTDPVRGGQASEERLATVLARQVRG